MRISDWSSDVCSSDLGVGSVGTRAWMILMKGVDDDDPLILQVKEAQPSVLSGYVDGPTFKNEGERVVNGQRLMQATSDIFLGRSEESRVWKECVSTCRSRWSPYA